MRDLRERYQEVGKKWKENLPRYFFSSIADFLTNQDNINEKEIGIFHHLRYCLDGNLYDLERSVNKLILLCDATGSVELPPVRNPLNPGHIPLPLIIKIEQTGIGATIYLPEIKRWFGDMVLWDYQIKNFPKQHRKRSLQLAKLRVPELVPIPV